jgi:hypothetical protein
MPVSPKLKQPIASVGRQLTAILSSQELLRTYLVRTCDEHFLRSNPCSLLTPLHTAIWPRLSLGEQTYLSNPSNGITQAYETCFYSLHLNTLRLPPNQLVED